MLSMSIPASSYSFGAEVTLGFSSIFRGISAAFRVELFSLLGTYS